MTVAELIQKLQQYLADAKLDSLTNPNWAKGKTVVFVEGNELDPLFQIKDRKDPAQ